MQRLIDFDLFANHNNFCKLKLDTHKLIQYIQNIYLSQISGSDMNIDWTNFRKDNLLSAKSELLGNITNPKIEWRDTLGGFVRDMYPVRNIDGSKDILFAAGGRIVRKNLAGDTLWSSVPKGLEGISFICDLDNDGVQEVGATNGRELFVFSSISGELLFSHYFGPPQSSSGAYSMIIPHNFDKKQNFYKVLLGLWSSRLVLVFDFSGGVKNGRLQHTIDCKDGFHPTVVAADIDNCGKDEIIVTKRGAIYYIDCDTGKVKKSIDWISGGERRRNYGLFQIADVNKDGNLECIVASSLITRHLSMIENDGRGNLSVKWDRFIEHIYPTDTTEVRHTYNSLNDVDGDGYPELVLSLYNTRNDKKWYTEIINPLTGEIKYEFPDTFIWGVQDTNGDGVYEIFASHETTRITKKYSETFILNFVNGKFKKMNSCPDSKFATRFVNSKSDLSIFRLEFLPDEIWTVNTKEGKGYLTMEDSGDGIDIFINYIHKTKSQKIKFENTNFVNIALVDDLDNDSIDEIVICDNMGEVRVMQIIGRIISKFEASTSLPFGLFGQNKPALTAVAFHNSENRTRCFTIPALLNQIYSYKFNSGTGMPEKYSSRAGVGKRGWSCNQQLGYVTKHNGELLTISASSKYDYSVLEIFNSGGKLIKQFEFKDFPAPDYNNRLGLYEWLLIDDKILLVSLYKSYSMNSEETFAFDFESGKQLWHRKEVGEGDFGRGFGAYGFTSYKKDENGRIHVFFLAKDTFCHFDALTGEFIKPPLVLLNFTEKVLKEKGIYDVSDESLATYTDPFSAYGSVTIADINNDGKDELLFFGCFNALGALDMDHNLIWWHNTSLSDLCMRYPGLCDIDNDGELEIGVGHINGDFICYSAKDGKEKWRFNLKGIASDIASCDIDGDGFYEFVFGTSDGRLLALGDKGKIKFEMKFDSSVGSPVITDLDGDGKAEILFVTGDGYINWLK